MSGLSAIAVSASAFVTTNLDDICLLVLFFSRIGNRSQKKYLILGEYLGIAALVVVSLFSAYGFAALLGRWLWLVGLLPIAFGIKAAIDLVKQGISPDSEIGMLAGTWSLVFKEWAVTVANGADNISVYIPLLAGETPAFQLSFFAVMMVMTTFWWLAAGAVVKLPKVGDAIGRVSRYILPVVFILVGAVTVIAGLGRMIHN